MVWMVETFPGLNTVGYLLWDAKARVPSGSLYFIFFCFLSARKLNQFIVEDNVCMRPVGEGRF